MKASFNIVARTPNRVVEFVPHGKTPRDPVEVIKKTAGESVTLNLELLTYVIF